MDDVTRTGTRMGRRTFLRDAAVASAGVAGSVAAPGIAGAVEPTAVPEPLPVPEPIPGGLEIGLPEPYDLIHIFIPGPKDVVLPLSGTQLQGLDVEPSTITDRKGAIAQANLIGSAKGHDGATYGVEFDLRVMEGTYRTDGASHRGLFAMIWLDLFEPGSGSQVHDYNGGIHPNGLFWTVQLRRSAFDIEEGRARLHARNVPVVDSFVFGGVFSVPATVDLDVLWTAVGPPRRRGSGASVPATDPAAFVASLRRASCTSRFSGSGTGFAFAGHANSRRGYAAFGHERNGSFL